MTTWDKTVDHVKRRVRNQVLALLPDWALTPLRRRHYLSVLKHISKASASDFVVIRHLVKPGDYVIDLGAHVGAWTKVLADLVGKEGRVFSVEPLPMNFDILSLNVRKLGMSNVEPINCAVSESNGRSLMEVPTFAEFGESFYDARLIPPGTKSSLRQAEVDVRTVDGLFLDLPRQVTFVKCDVEGQELQTLRAATRLIEKDRPAWLLEISLMNQQTHDQVRQLLGRLGYQEFCVDAGKLRLWESGDQHINVFFLQPQHLQTAKQAGLV